MKPRVRAQRRPSIERTAAASAPRRRITASMKRDGESRNYMRKEALLARTLATQGGLEKIAANMANPVRTRLDYKGIGRKFMVIEQMPDGIPLIFDRDFPDVPAIKAALGGSVRMIDMKGLRVELEHFEITAGVRIPYAELHIRRFRAMERARDRLIEGMQLREDLVIFSLIEDASVIQNTTTTTTSYMDRDALAKTFYQIDKNRLPVGAVLMGPDGTMGLRRWDFLNLDQTGMQEVRETGYLGSIWGVNFFVSDQIPVGTAYVLSTPKFSGWFPLRKDVTVNPADEPWHNNLGFTAYLLGGMTWHNTLAAAKLTFNTSA